MHVLPFLLAYLIIVPQTAQAYLDPGSGSLIVQVILAFFVGTGFAVKTNWQRAKKIFTRKTPTDAVSKDTDSEKHE